MKRLSITDRLRAASVIFASVLMMGQILPILPTLAFEDELPAQSSAQSEDDVVPGFEAELPEDETDKESPANFDADPESSSPETPSAVDAPAAEFEGNTDEDGSESEPVTEPETEPSTEPKIEPAAEPVTEPAAEAVTEPVTEPVTEAVTEPITETVSEPVTEPPTEPPTEPATEPATEPVTESKTEQATEQVTEPETEPVKETITEPATEPVTEPVTEPETSVPDPLDDEGTVIGDNVIPDTVNFTDAGPYLGDLVTVRAADIFPVLQSRSSYNTNSVPIDGGEKYQNGIGLGKYILPAADPDQRTLRLEAYTSGTVTSSEVGIPLDIVLVLDTSRSMRFSFSGIDNNSDERINALKASVTSFIGDVQANASENGINHRVGIVRYASSSSDVIGMSPLRTAAQRTTLVNAVNGISTPTGATSIDLGVTRGVNMLNTPLDPDYNWNDPPGVDRGRVMIVFTDGYPTTSTDFDIGTASAAINNIHAVKSNTTVYTVGIFGGANPAQMFGNAGFDQNSNGDTGTRWFNTKSGLFNDPSTSDWNVVQVPAANRFMNLLSSNSANATAIGLTQYSNGYWSGWNYYTDYGYKVTGTSAKDRNGYYLSASDADSLDAVFESIADSISNPEIALPQSTTEVVDTLTDQFRLPAGATPSSVRVRTYESLGKDGSGKWIFSSTPNPLPDPHLAGVTVLIDGKAVKIQNYDFNANFVSENPKDDANDRGRKLVFEFEIEREPTFFGGNSVPTNAAHAGIFNKTVGTAYATFPRVVTNPRLKFDFEVTPQAIYLGNMVDLAESVTFKTSGGISFKPDGFNNGYADIEIQLFDGSEQIGTYLIPAGTDLTGGGQGVWTSISRRPTINKAYQVKVKVTPSLAAQTSEAGVTPLIDGPRDLGVEIYRPRISAEDTYVFYGDTLDMTPLYTTTTVGGNPVRPQRVPQVTWHRDMTGANFLTDLPTEPPPHVDFRKPEKQDVPQAYALEAFTPERDTPFELDVWLVSGTVPMHIGMTSTDGRHADPQSDFSFMIWLRYGSLVISKTVPQGQLLDPNQTFIFEVTRAHAGQTSTWLVAIQGRGSRTLTGLPKGNYVVTELVEWSWRYTPDAVTRSTTINAAYPDRSVSFKNTLTDGQWLSGDNSVINSFDAAGPPIGPTLGFIGGVSDEDRKKR